MYIHVYIKYLLAKNNLVTGIGVIILSSLGQNFHKHISMVLVIWEKKKHSTTSERCLSWNRYDSYHGFFRCIKMRARIWVLYARPNVTKCQDDRFYVSQYIFIHQVVYIYVKFYVYVKTNSCQCIYSYVEPFFFSPWNVHTFIHQDVVTNFWLTKSLGTCRGINNVASATNFFFPNEKFFLNILSVFHQYTAFLDLSDGDQAQLLSGRID